MISNENDFQWDLLQPPQVHYCRGCWLIRGVFHYKFPGFSGFGFWRKIAHTKTQQGTDKASEHNGCAVLSQALVSGVMSTSSYNLSSIHYTSSQFAPTCLFASASAIDIVCWQRQSMPPLTTEYAVPLVQVGIQNAYDRIVSRPPNIANMTMTTYHATYDLSANQRASGDASALRLRVCRRHCYRPLRQKPETCKGATDPSVWPEKSPTILHLHLLLRHRLQLRRHLLLLPWKNTTTV